METILDFLDNVQFLYGLGIGGIIFIPIFFLLICYKVLAPRNIFFTFGKENRAMHVMLGSKFSGKVIMPSKTCHVDENYEIKKGGVKQRNILGMHWIGIYPFYSIYKRHQQWFEWESKKTGRELKFRDETTPYLIVKPFEYAMVLIEAEDANGVPLTVKFTVILVPTNVIVPIFGNDDAYGQVQTMCLGEALLFVKKKTFADLGAGNVETKMTKDDFANEIRSLNKEIPGRFIPDSNDNKKEIAIGIKEALGYEILDAKLNSIEISGPHKETLLSATTKRYEAENEFKAKEFQAKGKKLLLDVDKEYLSDISKIPGAMKVEERKATPALTTLVEGNSEKNLSIIIGGK